MKAKLTRRQLAAVIVPAALPLAAQTSTSTPERELAAARDRIKSNGETLARVPIPMATEPAFQFKA